MAHRDFYVLERFLELMDDEDHDFFLHLDKDIAKESIPENSIRKCVTKGKLHIYSTYSVNWGGFSIVETELFLFRKAFQSGKYAYFHLCSGADLPIKPVDEIKTFFEENQGKEFITYEQNQISERFLDRVRFFYVSLKEKDKQKEFNEVLVAIQKELGLSRINSGECYQKGAQWASLTSGFVEMMLGKETWIRERFRNTLCADEMYKHTIMVNSKYERNRVNNNLRKIDWNRGEPYVWRLKDFDELMSSDCLYARKFDSSVDREIIDQIYHTVILHQLGGSYEKFL